MSPLSRIDPAHARALVASWERAQQRYAVDRAERSEIVAALVATALQPGLPASVIDVGCGPGSLANLLAERHPDIDVVGIDADPLLLALGRAVAGPRVRLLEARAGASGWQRAVGARHPVAAVVGSGVFHYPSPDALAIIYRDVHDLLRPGGLFVNADHLEDGGSRLRALRRAIATPPGSAPAPVGSEWASWWREAGRDPSVRAALPGKPLTPVVAGENGLTIAEHEQALRTAGFEEIGVTWRHGPSAVLVAVR